MSSHGEKEQISFDKSFSSAITICDALQKVLDFLLIILCINTNNQWSNKNFNWKQTADQQLPTHM